MYDCPRGGREDEDVPRIRSQVLRMTAALAALMFAGATLAGCSSGGQTEIRFHLSKPEAIP